MVALLHDSLEDAPGSTVETVEEMEQFIKGSIQDPAAGEVVINGVRSLTHEKNAPYADYVVSLLNDPLALKVKLADMVHNLSSTPTPRQKQKYKKSIEMLSDVAGGLPTGISPKHWNTLISLTVPEEMLELRSVIKGLLLL